MSAPTEGKLLVIIGCEVLQDEVVHLLHDDVEVASIIIPPGPGEEELRHKLSAAGLGGKIRVMAQAPAKQDLPPGMSVQVLLNTMAHHSNPDELQAAVRAEVKEADKVADSILVFYGLCGNALINIDALSQNFEAPVTIVRDRQGKIADDCVGMLIGDRKRYLELLRSSTGSLYMSPAWAEHWRKFMMDIQMVQDINDLDGAKFVFPYMGYKRVVMLETGLGNEEEFKRQVDEVAGIFGFSVERVHCSTARIDAAYSTAKGYLAGDG
ncbi:MAG: DUF1638 domain-containing protein [Methanomassiliicoccales archaeon]